MRALILLFHRESSLAWGRGGGPLLAVGFFAAMTVMFPFAIGPAPERLSAVAGAVAWVGLALASLLSLERVFERDFDTGALDLLALGPLPLEVVCAAKALAQWIANGAPLAVAAPFTVMALGGRPDSAFLVAATAAIGGLAFAFVGGAGAALALASRRGGVLIALIVLPLLTPPVIFGGTAMSNFAFGLHWQTGFILLCAYTLAAMALTPFAMAGACRNALS